MTAPLLPAARAIAQRLRPLALATASVLLLVACGGDATDPDDATDTPPPAADPDNSEADADEATTGSVTPGTEITLLTHDSFDVSEEVMAAFTDDTGVEVAVVPLGDAGSALNQTILTADDPQGDLLFGVDTSFLSRALDAELFVPYASDGLDQVDASYQLDPEHRVTPVDVGDVCLNYDAAAFADSDLPLPADLIDLTDPAYEGLLTVTNPATSSPGLSFLLATIDRFGEDGYLDFWSDLVANDVLVTDGWSEAYYDEFSATGVGTRPLVVSYASSPPAEVFYAEEALDEAPTGVIEASCFRQVEFVGILEGTPHVAEAQALIDFMLSTTFQEDVPLTMFVFPVNGEAQLPEVFEQHTVLPADPLELDPEVIGANRDAWINAWTETVLR